MRQTAITSTYFFFVFDQSDIQKYVTQYLNSYEIVSCEGLISKQFSPIFGFDVELLNCLYGKSAIKVKINKNERKKET